MKRSFLLCLLMAFLASWVTVQAEETLTVNDGTTTNSYVPVNGLYADYGTRSQFVVPAGDLEDLANGTITAMKIYSSASSYSLTGTWDLYLKEVSETSASSTFISRDDATLVWTGSPSVTSNEWVITFSASFSYGGGNLMIEFVETNVGNCPSSSWYGVSGKSSVYKNGTSSDHTSFQTATTGTSNDFVPKVTFTYEPGEAPACAKPRDFAASEVAATSVKLSWAEKGEATAWQIMLNDDEENLIAADANPFVLDNGLTAETAYRVKVRAHCSETEQSDWSNEVNFTTEPTCPKPTVLSATSGMTVFGFCGEFTWSEIANADHYEVSYSVNSDFSDPVVVIGDEEDEYIGEDSYFDGASIISDELEYNTIYYVRVRAICGDNDESQWSDVISFKTQCAAVTEYPWSENFDDVATNTLPDCWGRINTATSSYYASYPYVTSGGRTGNGLYFYAYGTSSSDQYAVLPQMSNLGGKRIVFWAKGYNTSSKLKVGRMTNPEDASTFVQMGEDILLTSSYAKYIVTLEGEGDYIAFEVPMSSSSYTYTGAYIDDITVEEIPACLEVGGLSFVSSATNSAVLNWNASESGEEAWDIYYSTENVAPTAETEPSIVGATAKEIPSGLNAATTYYVWVRANCGTSHGAWSEAISFETKCEAVVISEDTPWSENFEERTTGNIDIICWKNAHVSGGGSSIFQVASGSDASTSGKVGKLPDMSSGTITDLTLPEMNIPAANAYEFFIDVYRNADGTSYPQEGLRILAVQGEESTELGFIARNITTVGTNVPAENAKDWYTYNFTIPYSGSVNIVVRGESKYGNATYFDNLLVRQIPSCLEPSGLSFVSSTTNSATFDWTAGGTETVWDIYYSTENVAPTAETAPLVAATAEKVIPSDLSASTTYFVWVRAHCSDEDQSPWVGGISFDTECEAISAASNWSDNFNRYTTSATSSTAPTNYPNDKLPVCWQFLNRAENSSTYPQVFLSSSESYATSGNCLFFKSSSSTPLYAILPEFEEEISGLQLTFTYRNEGTGTSNGTLYVGYLTDPTDADTFVPVLDCDQTTTLTEMEATFAAAPAGSYIAFKYAGGSNNNYYLSIDDVVVGPIPTCIKPAVPVCEAKTAHTATLSWTNGAEGQEAWQIAVDTIADFNPDTLSVLRGVTTNPAIINGLEANKTYYAYVRANCGLEDGVSAWSKKNVSFTTLAGNIAPSAVAVDGPSLKSNEATITWIGANSNDLHEGFDLYYSKMNAMPEELAADSLFTAVTETFKVLANLDPETTYYVWVRDNCGEDGMSAWTSAFSFTTLANCPVPAELSASEIEATSAKIAWNVGTNDSYNVRYRTAALDNVIFSEGFESSSMPEGWTTDGNGTWSIGSGDYSSSTGAGEGTYNAKITHGTTGNATKLIMPELDLSGNTLAMLSYMHIQRSWSGDKDALRVYYRASSSDAWTLLEDQEYTDEVASWTTESSIALPNISATYQIAFEMTDAYGYGVGIDNIVIFGAPIAAGDWKTKEGTTADKFMTLTDLTPETKYEAQVQGVCGGNATEWNEGESVFFTTIPSCLAPTALEKSEVAAHTVLLSWTENGEATAWQICVNGDEENLIDVTENPFLLPNLTAETAYTVKVRANCGAEDQSGWSNTVNFTTLPSCYKPTNPGVVADSITANSAILSWTDEHDQAGYIIAYGLYNDFDIDDPTTYVLVAATDTFKLLEGLEEATNYRFRVKSDCGEEGLSKDWSSYASFTTTCAMKAVPFSEDFEDASRFSYCWGKGNREYSSSTYYDGSRSSSAKLNGDYGLYLNASKSSYTTADSSYAVLPELNFGEEGIAAFQMTFNAKAYTSTYGSYYQHILIGVADDDELTNLEIVADQALTTDFAEYEVSFAAQAGNKRIVLLAIVDPESTGSRYAQIYVDDIYVSHVADCKRPNGLAVSEITTTSAKLAWTENGEATAWQICLNGDEENLIDATENPFVLDLTAATAYTAKVRANCGESQSDWSAEINFTTSICEIADQKAVRYEIWDTYGDGWQGAILRVTHKTTNAEIASLTVSSSDGKDHVSGTLNLCCDEEYLFTWVSGTYDSECRLAVYDINDEIIIDQTSAKPTAGTLLDYTMDCTLPTCIKPTDLAVSEITATSAKLAWTAQGEETAWQIMLNDDEENLIDVTENPYVLTLDPSSAYSVKVRANCSAEDKSDWSAAVEFRTPCVATVVDADNAFEEGFEDTDFAPACWESIVFGSYAWSRNTSASNVHSGSASAKTAFYGDIYLVMPELAIAEDAEREVKMSFWSYNTYPSDYGKNSVVLLGENNTEIELWSPASVSQLWVKDSIDLSAYKGQTIRLAFKYEGSNAHGWYLDDVKIEFVEKPIYTVTFAAEGAEGIVPAALTVQEGESIEMPINKTLYTEGKTLTAWSDGANTYAAGESFVPTADVTLNAIFTDNTVNVLSATEEVIVKWYFGESNGAPSVHWESGVGLGLLVTQTTIGSETIDVKLAIDATNGKFFNAGRGDQWAQVNANTLFTFPYKTGMSVDVEAYTMPADYNLGDGTLLVTGNNYFSYLQITLPATATALDNTGIDTKAIKRLENGILVIELNGTKYNAQGMMIRK